MPSSVARYRSQRLRPPPPPSSSSSNGFLSRDSRLGWCRVLRRRRSDPQVITTGGPQRRAAGCSVDHQTAATCDRERPPAPAPPPSLTVPSVLFCSALLCSAMTGETYVFGSESRPLPRTRIWSGYFLTLNPGIRFDPDSLSTLSFFLFPSFFLPLAPSLTHSFSPFPFYLTLFLRLSQKYTLTQACKHLCVSIQCFLFLTSLPSSFLLPSPSVFSSPPFTRFPVPLPVVDTGAPPPRPSLPLLLPLSPHVEARSAPLTKIMGEIVLLPPALPLTFVRIPGRSASNEPKHVS